MVRHRLRVWLVSPFKVLPLRELTTPPPDVVSVPPLIEAPFSST